MEVRFWGTRGSLPIAADAAQVRDKVAEALVAANGRRFANPDEARAYLADELPFSASASYGGASSCVEIETTAEAFFVCDAGSGLRGFGIDAMRRCAAGHARRYNLFLSHLHWDHIMGFPFFGAAFDPGATIRIHAGHEDAERALRRQQEEISFPVPFDWLRAKIEFVTMTPGQPIDVDGVRVEAMEQFHSHASYGYRFTDTDGKTCVYSTDSEHKLDRMEGETDIADFFRDADLVICDTMYSLADSVSMKEDWGHSSNIVAVDLCHAAGARRLALFHHEPTYTDRDMDRMHEETVRYEELIRDGRPLEVICSYDGLRVAL